MATGRHSIGTKDETFEEYQARKTELDAGAKLIQDGFFRKPNLKENTEEEPLY